MIYRLMIVIVVMLVPTLKAQEPASVEGVRERIRELRSLMLEQKNAAELEWLYADLIENGASLKTAQSMVDQIATLASRRPVSFDRTRRRANAELATIDSDKAEAFFEEIQNFRRTMLERRATLIDERLRNKSGSGCLAGIIDCIEIVDRVDFDCIEEGLSLSYCSDLWLDNIGICEGLAEECGPN